MGIEENSKQPIVFKIGERFKQLHQICPNCKEDEIVFDKIHNTFVCVSCGFEIEYEGETE